jgi:hypothetical protein
MGKFEGGGEDAQKAKGSESGILKTKTNANTVRVARDKRLISSEIQAGNPKILQIRG